MILDSGDARLFEALKSKLESALPSEAIEWKRSFGRASKNVVVEAKFIPLNVETLSASSSLKSLLDLPIFHTYWVECPVREMQNRNDMFVSLMTTFFQDADAYKYSVKEELANWLTQLRQCGAVSDWMIVLVETSEASR
jgi:hypothetical protein